MSDENHSDTTEIVQLADENNETLSTDANTPVEVEEEQTEEQVIVELLHRDEDKQRNLLLSAHRNADGIRALFNENTMLRTGLQALCEYNGIVLNLTTYSSLPPHAAQQIELPITTQNTYSQEQLRMALAMLQTKINRTTANLASHEQVTKSLQSEAATLREQVEIQRRKIDELQKAPPPPLLTKNSFILMRLYSLNSGKPAQRFLTYTKERGWHSTNKLSRARRFDSAEQAIQKLTQLCENYRQTSIPLLASYQLYSMRSLEEENSLSLDNKAALAKARNRAIALENEDYSLKQKAPKPRKVLLSPKSGQRKIILKRGSK